MTRPRHADISRARDRALGVLIVILIVLTVFSFAWFLIIPHIDAVGTEAMVAHIQGS